MSSCFQVLIVGLRPSGRGSLAFPAAPLVLARFRADLRGFPVDRLPRAPAAAPTRMQAQLLSLQVRSLRDLHSPPETPLPRWTVAGPPLLSFTLNTPLPALLCASTPGRRCRLPSARRCQPPDLVQPTWSLTTSTACSALKSSGLLHPETGHGVRRVSNSCHPSPPQRR